MKDPSSINQLFILNLPSFHMWVLDQEDYSEDTFSDFKKNEEEKEKLERMIKDDMAELYKTVALNKTYPYVDVTVNNEIKYSPSMEVGKYHAKLSIEEGRGNELNRLEFSETHYFKHDKSHTEVFLEIFVDYDAQRATILFQEKLPKGQKNLTVRIHKEYFSEFTKDLADFKDIISRTTPGELIAAISQFVDEYVEG